MVKLKIGHFLGDSESKQLYQFQYQSQPFSLLVQGGAEIMMTVTGNYRQAELCARCGKPVEMNLALDVGFTAGGSESDWSLANGQLDTDELMEAAIQLTNPLITYCNKCNNQS